MLILDGLAARRALAADTAITTKPRPTAATNEAEPVILKRFYDEQLAQASYLIGCGATGSAVIIDPLRDVAQYLRAAEGEHVRITHVT